MHRSCMAFWIACWRQGVRSVNALPLLLIVLLSMGALALALMPIWRPLTTSRLARSGSWAGRLSAQAAELSARRDAIYAALRDADFDHLMGKLSEEDYQVVRHRYMLEAARVLRQLDQLTPRAAAAVDSEIERAVAGLRSQLSAARGSEVTSALPPEMVQAVEAEVAALVRHSAAGPQAGTCPDCGRAYQPDDAFCTACGAPLANLCPQCGAARRADDRFCAQCGQAFDKSGMSSQ